MPDLLTTQGSRRAGDPARVQASAQAGTARPARRHERGRLGGRGDAGLDGPHPGSLHRGPLPRAGRAASWNARVAAGSTATGNACAARRSGHEAPPGAGT
ncbi:hypothetical protein GCM10010515_68580 [Streptomyces fructofermentans]|uniref:Uncharacterized protein n=1 Tax=Streptomyces fructofermentans TaxID=152141 RepID=A0A918NSA7_9ACTN|nr:hypothetical protein GCM10010515_68580 [Streptomyces fructofermentans]